MEGLLRQKQIHYFRILDADGDGFITRDDLLRIGHALGDARAYPTDSDEYLAGLAVMERIWDKMTAIDVNGDGRVSSEEWLAFQDAAVVSCTHAEYEKYNLPIVDTVFRLIDGRSVGGVTVEDYRQFLEAFGANPADAASVHERLDINGDGVVSLEEFRVRVEEFLRGDDPEAPGNWLFGELPESSS